MENSNDIQNTTNVGNEVLADVSGSLLDKAIELFDMLSDSQRIIVMDGYCKGCGRKEDGGICVCADF